MRNDTRHKRNFISRLSYAGLASCMSILSACSTAPSQPASPVRGDYEYTKQYISWLLQKEMRKHQVEGVSIALVDDQTVVWAQGYGYADVARKIPASAATVYRVGSVSKLFTVTAAMQLAEQGKVDIDRPLQTYLPKFAIKTRFEQGGAITPRTLMTHHAGLPADLLKGFWTDTPFTQVVDQLRDEYAAYPPNTVFSYSNDGMTLLGHMVQEVSGKDFVAYVDDALLRPLGMAHASFALRSDIQPLLAQGYKDGKAAKLESLRDLPAGNLYASVADLSRFMQMVFADGRAREVRILKPETLVEILRPQNADVPLDLDMRIGLGWLLGGYNLNYAGKVASHAGATQIFHTQLITLPEHKLGVVVAANSASARSVVDKIAVAALKLALEAKTGIAPLAQAPPPAHVVPLTDVAHEQYPGLYATVLGLVSITVEGEHLRAQVLGKTLRLVPYAEGSFGLQYRLLGFIPLSLGELDQVRITRKTVAGREIIAAHYQGQDLLVGVKVEPRPMTEEWRKRLGDYELVDLREGDIQISDIRLVEENSLLILEYKTPEYSKQTLRTALAVVSDTEAVVLGLGQGAGGTIRVVNSAGEERVRVSGFEARRLVK